jgi:hypothetical protein
LGSSPLSEAILKKALIEGYIKPVVLTVKGTRNMQAQVVPMSLQVQTERVSQGAVVAATLLVLLQILDGILTHRGLSLYGGVGGEGNGLLRYAMSSYGIIPALIMAKGMAVSLIFALCSISHRVNWIENAFKGLIALYLVFAILPWTGILLS